MRVVSGGQTGADRAALDAAASHGFAIGGWCPRGRRAEDGRIPDGYPLVETPSYEYVQRTRWNVRDSDGTLIIGNGDASPGTRATKEHATACVRPVLEVCPESDNAVDETIEWLQREGIGALNVAGPRDSQDVGIYYRTRQFLDQLFRCLDADRRA